MTYPSNDNEAAPATVELAIYHCRRTTYAGHEQEILRLRNANRESPKAGDYMAWRYRLREGLPAPEVFWLHAPSGEVLGMASLLFHRYWDDGRPVDVPVLGDISLEGAHRGKGLGLKLLRFVTERLDAAYADRRALVIPTEAARKSLVIAGWNEVGRFNQYTLMLNPQRRLPRLLGRGEPAAFAAWLYRAGATGLLKLTNARGCRVELDLNDDAASLALWNAMPKADRMVRDLTPASLAWRYRQHPSGRFRIAGIWRQTHLVGLLAYEVAFGPESYTLHDFLVGDPGDLPAAVALFARHCLDAGHIESLHLALSDKHPARSQFLRLGFLPRPSAVIVQQYVPAPLRAQRLSQWSITYGDKDV